MVCLGQFSDDEEVIKFLCDKEGVNPTKVSIYFTDEGIEFDDDCGPCFFWTTSDLLEEINNLES